MDHPRSALRRFLLSANAVATVGTVLCLGLALVARASGVSAEDAAAIVVPTALAYVVTAMVVSGLLEKR